MQRVTLVYAKAAAVVSLVAIGWFARSLVGFSIQSAKVAEPKVQSVRVAAAKRVPFNPPTEYVGHVEPKEVTDILPQIDGYVKKVCFAEGAYVTAGELLFEIDAEQYEAAKNFRYSEVRSAEAKVIVARAEVDRAERYFKRLAAADDRGITATELDTAETTLASAKAELNAANAAVEQAKASAAIADFNLNHTKVYSPISGRIGKALHHVGDFVSPSKTPLARVVQLDPIRVVFPITDRDYDSWQAAAEKGGSKLNDSRRLRIRLPNGEIYASEGEIEFGNNEMSRETGTLVMYVSFANPAGRLVPNAFVRVISDLRSPPVELTVPSTAVELGDGYRRVWKFAADGGVKSAVVEVGAEKDGLTVITKGLEEGERIVTVGGFKLSDGIKVEVVE